MKYNIMQLNGGKLLEGFHVVQDENSGNYIPSFELNYGSSLWDTLDTVESYQENAFFYQVKKCLIGLKKEARDSWNPDSLLKYLIYINFDRVFGNVNIDPEYKEYGKDKTIGKKEWKMASADAKAYILFKNGLVINIPSEGKESPETRIYKPFDRSSSMARDGRIIFIDSNIYDRVNERLMLGVKNMMGTDNVKDQISMNLSKLYAYRGLYLSNATRITNDDLVLNEKTVCVIKDDNAPIIIPKVYTADKKKKSNDSGSSADGQTGSVDIDPTKDINKEAWEYYDKEQYECECIHFDGEGLISPYYSDMLNKSLKSCGIIHNKNENATSFQIRMPFVKGMLHEVNFKSFIRWQLKYHIENSNIGLKTEDFERIYIKDIFGQKRLLKDIQIILTQSMFKGFRWMRKTLNPADRIADYFKRFHTYDHALYIGNTDVNLSRKHLFEGTNNLTCSDNILASHVNQNTIKMNYQFLNTLKLDSDDLKKLVEKHIRNAHNMKNNSEVQIARLLENRFERREDENEGDIDTQSSVSNAKTGWQTALSLNSSFLNHPRIKNEVSMAEESAIRDIALGRIEVSGSLLFLSNDLLSLLIHFIRQIDVGESDHSKELGRWIDILANTKPMHQEGEDGKTGVLVKKCLREESFYVADSTRLEIDGKRQDYYSIFRSPHLSRNEQCLLKPYLADNTDRIRTEIYNEWFSHLKGVLMIAYGGYAAQALGGADFDGDMVKVITEPIINDAVMKGCYKDNLKEDGKDDFERTIPVVLIPDNGGKNEKVVGKEVDYETIRNSFASRVGKISNFSIKCGRKQYWNEVILMGGNKVKELPYCEQCTIMTGLEIDAAKTGVHPELPDIIDKLDEDYFIKKKDEIKRINSKSARDKRGYYVELDETSEKYILKDSHNYNKVVFSAEKITNDLERSIIDRLPYYYLEDVYKSQPNMDKGSEKKDKELEEKKTTRKHYHFFTFATGKWKHALRTKEEKELEGLLKEIDTCRKTTPIEDYRKKINRSKELLEDTNSGKLKQLIAAYNMINRASVYDHEYEQSLKNNNYIAKIYVNLMVRYGLERDEIVPGYEKMTIDSIVDHIIDNISNVFAGENGMDLAAINESINRVKELNWIYAGASKEGKEKYEQREQILNRILICHEDDPASITSSCHIDYEADSVTPAGGDQTDYECGSNNTMGSEHTDRDDVSKSSTGNDHMDRGGVLTDITKSVLTDFYEDGDKILLYILYHLKAKKELTDPSSRKLPSTKTIVEILDNESVGNDILTSQVLIKQCKYYQQCYSELYQIYRNAKGREIPVSKDVWKNKIQQYCRAFLGISTKKGFDEENRTVKEEEKIFNNLDSAIKYTYAESPNGSFFWEIFTPDEIAEYVYIPEENEYVERSDRT